MHSFSAFPYGVSHRVLCLSNIKRPLSMARSLTSKAITPLQSLWDRAPFFSQTSNERKYSTRSRARSTGGRLSLLNMTSVQHEGLTTRHGTKRRKSKLMWIIFISKSRFGRRSQQGIRTGLRSELAPAAKERAVTLLNPRTLTQGRFALRIPFLRPCRLTFRRALSYASSSEPRAGAPNRRTLRMR